MGFPRPDKLRVINFFAGPGTGKSTTAAALFAQMKWGGFSVELVTEYAKDLVWENNERLLQEGQPLILGEQYWRLKRLQGKVSFAVCDSPLLLSIHYNHEWMTHLDAFAWELYRQFDNYNILLERNPKKPYKQEGRVQDEVEAKKVCNSIRKILEDRGIGVHKYQVTPTIHETILQDLISHLAAQ